VRFESQSFMHADWSIARTNVSSGGCQAASFLNSAAVHLRNSSGCTFFNCTVEHVGECERSLMSPELLFAAESA